MLVFHKIANLFSLQLLLSHFLSNVSVQELLFSQMLTFALDNHVSENQL